MSVQIPNKLYFKIGEVARITGVKPHVLRYWEQEFGYLKPSKSKGRQRLYQQHDIERVLRVKDLLYNKGMTIAGAKKALAGQTELPQASPTLKEIRNDLEMLRDRLARPWHPGRTEASVDSNGVHGEE